jgi:hypothetical protein
MIICKCNRQIAQGHWFSTGTLAFSTTKTGRHDIVEILLKVALKHTQTKKKSNELLPGKCEEIYFNLLKTTCQQHQLQLTPQTFFIDFETATHNSAQRAFTQA